LANVNNFIAANIVSHLTMLANDAVR